MERIKLDNSIESVRLAKELRRRGVATEQPSPYVPQPKSIGEPFRDVFANARHAKLERLVDIVDGLYKHARPEAALAQLVRDEGAGTAFREGTHTLTLGGVRGTCTAGGKGLLESWLRQARKRLGRREDGR